MLNNSEKTAEKVEGEAKINIEPISVGASGGTESTRERASSNKRIREVDNIVGLFVKQVAKP